MEPAEKSSVDVFVSYASEDRETVRALVTDLEANGFSVWWDRSIGAGAAFDREIERALDAASAVLVLWSPASIESDWVRAEAYEGLNRGVLVPVVVGDVRPPLAFRQTQVITLDGGHQAVVEAVRATVPEGAGRETDSAARIRYCRTPDDVQIAYVTQGSGPPLVRCLAWITSSSLELSDRSLLSNELRKDFSLLTYDGRGCGLSERGIFEWTLEERLTDLATVIEASSIETPFALFGISEGARTAIAFAARYPEKVSHLVLHGPVASNPRAVEENIEAAAWFIDFIKLHWGTTIPMARRMLCAIWSSTSSEDEQIAYMEQMRQSMSPEAAAAYLVQLVLQGNDESLQREFWETAARVSTPTLIVHSVRDPMVPFEGAQKLASVMPNAELLPLTIEDHGTGLSRELDRIQARETRRFVLNQ